MALAEVIGARAPDLVVLQEATRPEVVAAVARRLGMPHWASHPGHSVGFLSRLPIAQHAWYRPAPSRRAFLEIVPEDLPLRVFGVHLSAVHSNWTEQRRVRELKALLAGIEQHQHGFHLVVGDFNTVAPGEVLDTRVLPYRFQAVIWLTGGRIRWQTIQIMLDAHYVDGYRALRADPGLTFPTWAPHVRLDYAFLPARALGRLKSCEVVSDAPGVQQASDHYPLLVELDLG